MYSLIGSKEPHLQVHLYNLMYSCNSFLGTFILNMLDCVLLSDSRSLDVRKKGHSDIRHEVPWKPWAFPMGYNTHEPSFKRNFAVGFPTRAEWKVGDGLGDYGPVFFIDWSEMDSGVEAGIFSDTHILCGIRQRILSRGTGDIGSFGKVLSVVNPTGLL